MRVALLGNIGRDEALASRLMEHELHILGEWENPGLYDKTVETGGHYHPINNRTDGEAIADLVSAIRPDMFITNFDASLAAGVVDAVQRRVADNRLPRLLIPSPNQAAARVEWDKFFLRRLIDEIDPKYNPINFMATTDDEVEEAFAYFVDANQEVAIKPRNLAGGKGVKVMGKHFQTFDEAKRYALDVLKDPTQTGVEVQERLIGHEFTLQILTDGNALARPPITYDFPYRRDNDEGPPTAGMGSFAMLLGERLPFLTDDDYDEAMALMESLLDKLRAEGLDYKGVLYPTFFKTAQGLKIVEVNARGGDPELINIVDGLSYDVDVYDVLRQIAVGEFDPGSVRFQKMASTVIYLTTPEYGYLDQPPYPVHEFEISEQIIKHWGVRLRFASSVRTGPGRFKTVGASRNVALSALGKTPWEARDKIIAAISTGFKHPLALEYRGDIGKQDYINSLTL